jgi:hypothetical protein
MRGLCQVPLSRAQYFTVPPVVRQKVLVNDRQRLVWRPFPGGMDGIGQGVQQQARPFAKHTRRCVQAVF